MARRPGAPTIAGHLPGAGTAGARQAGALQASALQAIVPGPPPDGVTQIAVPAGGVVVSRRGSSSVPPAADNEGVEGLTAAQPSKGAGGTDRLGDLDVIDGGVVFATRSIGHWPNGGLSVGSVPGSSPGAASSAVRNVVGLD